MNGFLDTADPSVVTEEDCASWADNLGKYIRDNPGSPDLWVVECKRLYKKLRGAEQIYNLREPDPTSQNEYIRQAKDC